jgi:hypothetical protein
MDGRGSKGSSPQLHYHYLNEVYTISYMNILYLLPFPSTRSPLEQSESVSMDPKAIRNSLTSGRVIFLVQVHTDRHIEISYNEENSADFVMQKHNNSLYLSLYLAYCRLERQSN